MHSQINQPQHTSQEDLRHLTPTKLTTPSEVQAHHHKQKLLPYVMIGILLLVVVGVASFYAGSIFNQEQKSETMAKAEELKEVRERLKQKEEIEEIIEEKNADTDFDTSDWQTYTNEEYGFEFKYPAQWENNDNTYSIKFGDQLSMMIIDINPLDCKGDCPISETNKEIIKNGVQMFYVTGWWGAIGGNIPQSYIEYIIPVNDKFITMTYQELKFDSTFDTVDPREKGIIPNNEIILFDQILSTFKFTENNTNIKINNTKITLGEVYTLTDIEQCVPQIKISLEDASSESIKFTMLEEQVLDHDFYPIENQSSQTISNDECIPAGSLCADVNYDYCFNIKQNNNTIEVITSTKSSSTMPTPNP